MKQSTVHDCRIIDIRKYSDNRGYLSVIEGGEDIPFEIKRIYYSTIMYCTLLHFLCSLF